MSYIMFVKEIRKVQATAPVFLNLPPEMVAIQLAEPYGGKPVPPETFQS